MIHVVWQVEVPSFVVAHSANQVDRVEMGAVTEQFHAFAVTLVYLAALKNLQTDRPIGIVGQERTASRFLMSLLRQHRSR